MRSTRPSTTAEIVCYLRATDQLRPPNLRILDDGYAQSFLSAPFRFALGARGAFDPITAALDQLTPGLGTYVLTRHRVIDDALVEALPSVQQIVLLGAGYDARAYRLPLGRHHVFEVDHPATSARKARIVAEKGATWPSPQLTRVTVDFATQSFEEELLRTSFDPKRTTFFVWEGVSMYLTREAIRSTLEAIARLSCDGSFLAMDYWFLLDAPDLVSTAHRISAGFVHLLGEPITFSLHPEDAPAFMARSGFRVDAIADSATLEAKYVRDGRKVYPANYVLFARPGSV